MKVLSAIADKVTAREIEYCLKPYGFEIINADNAKTAWQLLQQPDAPQFLILDSQLPGTKIEKFCERIRQLENGDDFYLVLLLPSANPGEFEVALDLGADDCIAKPINAVELKLRARGWSRVTDLQRQVKLRASHDALTGIWNHGVILEITQREVERAVRDGAALSILVSNIDFLPALNDEHGHRVGDEVLRAVAERMRVALRSYDMFGRYSGGKFLAVIPRCSRANALEIAERLRIAVRAKSIKSSAGHLSATISIGVATMLPGQITNAEKIVKAADSALYKSKREGGDRVEMAVSLKSHAGHSI
ncbi:MAG: diguanylate cyclase [Gammaproteobacteria bacterium]|nr:diguanylate cyclase [Gammaproteobacteria bacterium]